MVLGIASIRDADGQDETFLKRLFFVRHQASCQAGLHRRYQLELRSAHLVNPFCQQRRFRAECLNANWFLPLADAREKMEAWLRYYNAERPHDAISYTAPIELTNPGSETGQLPR